MIQRASVGTIQCAGGVLTNVAFGRGMRSNVIRQAVLAQLEVALFPVLNLVSLQCNAIRKVGSRLLHRAMPVSQRTPS